MTLTVGHQHHAELLPRVDALRALADQLGELEAADVRARLGENLEFIHGQLVPHMEMAERAIYPELDRLLEDPRAMAPLRREHEELRRLVAALQAAGERLAEGPMLLRDEMALRRLLYRLFVLVRVHLFEEERYLAIVDRNTRDDQRSALVAEMRHATLERL